MKFRLGECGFGELYSCFFPICRIFFILFGMTHLDTTAVHAGRDDLAGLGVHVPPIDLSRVLR